jgi:hypothetical protein
MVPFSGGADDGKISFNVIRIKSLPWLPLLLLDE